eukprot:716387-Amphidinium_carterae.1
MEASVFAARLDVTALRKASDIWKGQQRHLGEKLHTIERDVEESPKTLVNVTSLVPSVSLLQLREECRFLAIASPLPDSTSLHIAMQATSGKGSNMLNPSSFLYSCQSIATAKRKFFTDGVTPEHLVSAIHKLNRCPHAEGHWVRSFDQPLSCMHMQTLPAGRFRKSLSPSSRSKCSGP